MAYICPTCGKIPKEWCDNCNTFVKCDHSDIKVTRIKELLYGDEYDFNVTVYVNHCSICGKIFSINY